MMEEYLCVAYYHCRIFLRTDKVTFIGKVIDVLNILDLSLFGSSFNFIIFKMNGIIDFHGYSCDFLRVLQLQKSF
jgi:hypothetical protein